MCIPGRTHDNDQSTLPHDRRHLAWTARPRVTLSGSRGSAQHASTALGVPHAAKPTRPRRISCCCCPGMEPPSGPLRARCREVARGPPVGPVDGSTPARGQPTCTHARQHASTHASHRKRVSSSAEPSAGLRGQRTSGGGGTMITCALPGRGGYFEQLAV